MTPELVDLDLRQSEGENGSGMKTEAMKTVVQSSVPPVLPRMPTNCMSAC